jgi:hypothetical protein
MPHISETEFRNRFVPLVIGARDLPKKPLDLNILYISAILNLDPAINYSEKELNEKLRLWSDRFGKNFTLDHVTLRRYLIDAGYITRDPAGKSYQVGESSLPYTFDPSLRNLDLETMIQEALKEREERKKQFMKSKDG